MSDSLTRWTAWAALAFYAAAVAGMLRARPALPPAWVRWAWTAGCLVFLVHVGCAFHFVHGWSHAAAYRRTAEQTELFVGISFGVGLYLNYAFALTWVGDVLWWWAAPAHRGRRPGWVDAILHGSFAFLAFNAAVVFVAGPQRWLGLAGALALAVLWLRTRPPRSPAAPS